MAPKFTPGTVVSQIPRHVVQMVSGMVGGAFGTGPSNGARPVRQPPPITDPNAPQSPRTAATIDGVRQVEANKRVEPWFGPLAPMRPMAPADTAGRAFDYPVGYNLNVTPRKYTGTNFSTLRGLADGYDQVRLAIETRKDQMAKLTWDIMPRMKPGENVRNKEDSRCQNLVDFFRRPDKKRGWNEWLRDLLEDQLVIDAASIYVRRTVGGDVYSLEVLDGSTIMPIIDGTGRQPDAPAPAYQQVLKGMPACNYSTDELLYRPRNKRPGRVYGLSPVEQIIMTINIAIRREITKLSFYTEGNIPEALIGVPEGWTPDQIERFQHIWDTVMTDPAVRRKARFVPSGTQYNATRPVETMDPQQDEWFARVVCYAFSLPALPFVQVMNRSTADTANEAALQEGLGPLMAWLKGLMDDILSQVFGFSDLEFVFDDIEREDPAERETRQMAQVDAGILTIDEVRAEMGKQPWGIPAFIKGVGPLGIMFIPDIIKAYKQGVFMPTLPGAPDAMGQPGMPMLPGAPGQMVNPETAALPGSNDSLPISAPAKKMITAPDPKGQPLMRAALTHIPPHALNAVGLKADYSTFGGKKTASGAAPGVKEALKEHEGRFKKK